MPQESLLLNRNVQKLLTTVGTAMLVSKNNTHKNDQALRSSQHSFHLEKRAFFSKDSDSAASPSIRDIQTLLPILP